MPTGQSKKQPNKSKYTSQDKVKVFEFIEQYFQANPELLKTEGIFRISGNSENISKLVEKIVKGKEIKSGEFSVHEYVGALKLLLKEQPLLQNETLTKALKNPPTTDQLSVEEATEIQAKVITDFMTSLAKSPNASDQQLAQMLYIFAHLMKKASEHAGQNRMTLSNMGIILGPNLMQVVVPGNADAATVMTLSPKLNHMSASALGSHFFNQPYEKSPLKISQTAHKTVNFQKGLESMDPSLFKASPTQTPLLKRTSSLGKLKQMITKSSDKDEPKAGIKAKVEGPDLKSKLKRKGA